MDMRHRSTPDSTCQRYALADDRVNSATIRADYNVATTENPAA